MAVKLNLSNVLAWAAVTLAWGLQSSGCGGGTASYTRFRAAAEVGRMIAPEEVRAEDFIAYHASEDAPRPGPGFDLGAPVLLDARMGSSLMPTRSERAAIQISLRGGVAAARAPSELVVLVDVSGSMQEGDKIGAVRHALARFVERLDARDHLAIVAFSDDAHVALAPSEVSASREDVLGAIGTLDAYGGTNLYAGLHMALAVSGSMSLRPDAMRRVILLSDGVASVGTRDPEAFAALARDAHARGISITTVGMGNEIDFDLLRSVAETAGGEFHYLDQPSEVERLFSTEIVALVAMAARDVRVRVRLPPGFQLAQSFSERSEVVGDVIETRVGDLASDGAYVVLHELIAPPGTSDAVVGVEVALTFEGGARGVVAETGVLIRRSDAGLSHTGGYEVAADPSVLRNLVLGRSAAAVRSASSAVSSGDTDRAHVLLTRALEEAQSAAATLVRSGEDARARSLEEPIALLSRTLLLVPVPSAPIAPGWRVHESEPASSTFAGWR